MSNMDLGLKGRRAMVLGASRGLGRAIAEALAAEGCDLVLCARNEGLLTEEAARLTARHAIHADACSVDLADDASVAAAAEHAQGGGAIDVLVNISGGPPPSGVLGVTPELWRRQFEAMVLGIIALTDAVVPGMRTRGWGRVLTVTSSGVVQPVPTLGMSNTLRASLVAFNKTLAGEVAADGVTANILVPGRIATERVAELDAATALRQEITVEEVQRRSHATIAAGRYGTVEEFASVAAFLASERAGYVTGSMIRVDGGLIRSL